MKLSKNVISDCHGYHFIELSRAILAFFVLLLGNNLRHGVDFFGPFVMMGVVMVHLHISTVNVIMLFFIFIIMKVLKTSIIFLAFNFTVRTLIWHLTV